MIAGTVTQSETQESAVVQYGSSNQAFYADFGIHYEWGATGQDVYKRQSDNTPVRALDKILESGRLKDVYDRCA